MALGNPRLGLRRRRVRMEMMLWIWIWMKILATKRKKRKMAELTKRKKTRMTRLGLPPYVDQSQQNKAVGVRAFDLWTLQMHAQHLIV